MKFKKSAGLVSVIIIIVLSSITLHDNNVKVLDDKPNPKEVHSQISWH